MRGDRERRELVEVLLRHHERLRRCRDWSASPRHGCRSTYGRTAGLIATRARAEALGEMRRVEAAERAADESERAASALRSTHVATALDRDARLVRELRHVQRGPFAAGSAAT